LNAETKKRHYPHGQQQISSAILADRPKASNGTKS